MTAMPEYVELPRPVRLLRTAGVSLAESFGLPTGGYAVAAWLAGRDAGLWTLLGVIWLTAGIRLLVTRSVPSLVLISLIMLTVQTVATIATGNLLIFLVHFPLADLGLCLLFARTARRHTPLAARLATEVIGLRSPAVHQPRLHPFFQYVTVLWAGVFLLLAAALGHCWRPSRLPPTCRSGPSPPPHSPSPESSPPPCGSGPCSTGSASASASRVERSHVQAGGCTFRLRPGKPDPRASGRLSARRGAGAVRQRSLELAA